MSILEKSTFSKMFEAAELCLELALDVPMIVLVYTSMDALAWARYGEKISGVRERFIALCDNYILPGSGVSCTALELYAARCSVLHTLGWESDLSSSGKARSIFYSFGAANPSLAQAALEVVNPGKFVSVRPEGLLLAVKEALVKIDALAPKDEELARRLSIAAGKQYRSLESSNADRVFGTFLAKSMRGERN